MRPEAIQIIKDEHSAIAAVLYTLRYLVKQITEAKTPANFPLLRAILDYIVAYPDRWHHPKEDKYLFARVRLRSQEGNGLIEALEREHQLAYPMIETLKQYLLDYQAEKDGAKDKFAALAIRYVELEWAHMRKEEDQFMPLAERILTDEDWQEIAAAFRENDNPLFGLRPKEDAERLYQRILSLAPAPIGYR